MQKKSIRDTFFLNPKHALKIAQKQNHLTISESTKKWSLFETDLPTQKRQKFYNDLQICYYPGKELEGNNIPKNCINVPFDSIFDFFKETRFRYPELVNFKGIDLNKKQKEGIVELFKRALKNASSYKETKALECAKIIKNNKPNFNEPLKVFLMAHRFTTVIQYVQKNIGKALKEMGYNVEISVEENNMESLHAYIHLKKFADFNPHVIISINNINNSFLNDDIFNFVWFQDPIPILFNDEKLKIRKRDILFSYLKEWEKVLENKGAEKDKIYSQYSCIDEEHFFIDKKIKRKNKIVFVGTYYTPEAIFQATKGVVTETIAKDIYQLLESEKDLNQHNIDQILKKHNKLYDDEVLLQIQQAFTRNHAVAWLCDSDISDYVDIEIYGWYWKEHENKNVKKYYKGPLEHKEIHNVYNSAKYALLASGRTINSQRLAETSACGCIPVIYDSRNIAQDEKKWDDECLYFKSKEMLKNIFKKKLTPKKDTKEIVDYLSYKRLANKIIKITKERLKNETK